MATQQAGTLLQHIRGLVGGGDTARLTDRQLLQRYTGQGDQAAFEALVRRHGPTVLRVCRSVLRDDAADDAFQATFLVLARKAGSVRRPELLASWLYGVAHRVSARARVEAAKRTNREGRAEPRAPADPVAELSTREVCAALEDEMARLPEKYRTPFYLCHVEGRTRDQAARQLGCSVRTLQRLLEQGRGLLAARLDRRGVTLAGALLALTLAKEAAPAAVPDGLLAATLATVRGALAGAGVPVRVTALAAAVLRRAAAARVKLFSMLALAALSVGAALVAQAPAPKSADRGAVPAAAPKKQEDRAGTDLLGDPLPAGARLRLGSLRLREGGPVSLVAFTPDGKSLVTGSWSAPPRLWDAATHKEIRQFAVPARPWTDSPNATTSLALAPDGQTLAAGTADGPIYLWDTRTGRLLQTLPGSRESVGTLAFSPVPLPGGPARNGARWLLASVAGPAARPCEVVLWDAAAGKELRRLKGSRDIVYALAFSPDGKLLAGAGEDKAVRLWDPATGELRHTLNGHGRAVVAMAFSPDGSRLASAGYDNTVRLWDPVAGRPLADVRNEVPVSPRAVAFSPDGSILAAAGDGRSVQLWNPTSGKRLEAVAVDTDEVRSLAFAGRGEALRLAVGAGDGTIRIWEWRGRRLVRPVGSVLGHQSGVYAVAVSPDGKTIATGSMDRTVRLWDAARGVELQRLEGHRDWVADLRFSPDGKLLASADNHNEVCVWDAASGDLLRRLTGRCVAFSPDGKLLATGSSEQAALVRIYETASGRELRVLRGHRAMIFRVAFSPDGRTLASGGMGVLPGSPVSGEVYEKTPIRLWDVRSGRLRFEFGHGAEAVYALAFTPDGRALVSGCDPRGGPDSVSLRLWETASGKERTHIGGHRDRAWSVAVSPDGRLLASASMDGTARLWDLRTRKLVRRLGGHRGWVTAVAFGPDGRTLVTGSWDTTALVWDVSDLVARRPLAKIDPVPGRP